jgi:hypothetical protein
MEPPKKGMVGYAWLSVSTVWEQFDSSVDGGCRLYRHPANVGN